MTRGDRLTVVFMGTPRFAVPSLIALRESHEVVAVVTRPDAVSGRGSSRRPSPVKTAALDGGSRVVEAASLRTGSPVFDTLAALRPDVVCVAAFGLLLPREVLAIPRFGSVNVHASLLPRHRGAAPIQRAILEGDEETGVSIMLMDEGLDTGPCAERVVVAVDRHDDASLTEALADAGAAALVRVMDSIAGGDVAWTEQDPSAATYAPKVSRADVALEPSLSVDESDRRVRASSDSAPCVLRLGEARVRVIAAEPAASGVPAGEALVGDRGLLIGLRDGTLELTRVRPEGRGDMSGSAFARGVRSWPLGWEQA